MRVGGRGADGDPNEGAAGTSSSSPTPVPVPSTAVVEPADGTLVKVPGASMRALSSYERTSDFGIVQGYNDGQSSLTFSPSLTRARSLDAFAREWIKEHGGPKVQVRQEDAVAGGKYAAWHVVDSTSDPVQDTHTFGIMFLDSAWLVNIRIYLEGFPEPLDEDGQQQVIDSLLASVQDRPGLTSGKRLTPRRPVSAAARWCRGRR